MVAFVGYVNSLVVESGILRELPDAIFCQKLILDAEQNIIDDIAAEEGDPEKREQNKRDFASLKRVLKALEEGLENAK